jgi:hypothetical protein
MDPGSHVGFQISTNNTNLVEDHPMNISGWTDGWTDDGRLPMTKAHMAYDQVS